jgi:hypothetical protein
MSLVLLRLQYWASAPPGADRNKSRTDAGVADWIARLDENHCPWVASVPTPRAKLHASTTRSARQHIGARQYCALVALVSLAIDQLRSQLLQQQLLAVLMRQRRSVRRHCLLLRQLLVHGCNLCCNLGFAHQRHLTVHLGTHPRMLLDLGSGDALARVLVEDAHQQIGTAGLDPRRPLGLLLAQDGLDRWQLVLGMVAVDAPERILAGLHHVQHDTETPDIEFGAVENGAVCGRIDLQAHGAKVRLRIEAERVQVARKGLGSRVVQGSRTRENTAFVLVVVASKAEIAELDVVAIIDKDVVGFQIYNREMTQVR